MHPTNAFLMARQMLDEQGLQDWGFKINTNKRRLGVCKYRQKRIEISSFHLPDGEDAVRDTIAHEVAHAIVGGGNGHNHIWRSKAIELGSTGNRLGKPMVAVVHKWLGKCSACGAVYKRHRRPSKMTSCGRCSGGRFDMRFLMRWTENRG